MIYERFIFIIVCSILTSTISHSSQATELKVINFSMATEALKSDNHLVSRDNGSPLKYNQESCCQNDDLIESSPDNRLIQSRIETSEKQQSTKSSSFSDVEVAPTINRRLYLVAMALTSAISLLLIWILFRKPPQKQEALAILPALKGSEDEQGFGTENKLPQQETVLSTESYVSARLPQEITLVNQANDNLPVLNPHQSPEADPAIGKIEIASQNSQMLEIDVVSELIKDLQQSDWLQNRADSARLSELRERQRQHNLRRKAIWELAKIGDHRSIEPLAKIMSQADSLDRSLICRAITQITNRSFQPINDKLFVLLENENPEVRKIAIRDLTALSKFTTAIAKRLEQMQSDPDREVRAEAANALQQLNFSDVSIAVSSHSSHKTNSLPPGTTGKESKANLYLVTPRFDNQESDLEG